jgi:hypothetical protein
MVEETTALLNSVDVIRRLTTLGFAEQEALLARIEQRLNSAQKLSVKDVVELIRAGRPNDAPKQLSFVDLGLDELDLYHQWSGENPAERPQKLSLDELDKLIELYERDLSKLRKLRTDKKA